MFAVIVTMAAVLGLAVLVAGVVAVGMKGKVAATDPRVRQRLATVARHLNGDAEPPKVFVEAVRRTERHQAQTS